MKKELKFECDSRACFKPHDNSDIDKWSNRVVMSRNWDASVKQDEPHDIPYIYVEATCPVCGRNVSVEYSLAQLFTIAMLEND